MPSNSVLEQKKAIVADLVEKIKKAQSGVLVQYQGITVENDTKMRAAFRKAGVDYMVIKNTLIGRACDEVGYEAMKANLNGMSAIAIGYDDPIAPAKIAKEYADKVETFEIKGGFLEKPPFLSLSVKYLLVGSNTCRIPLLVIPIFIYIKAQSGSSKELLKFLKNSLNVKL